MAVPGLRAEALRRELHARGLVDRSVRVEKRGGRVLIPIRNGPLVDLAAFDAELVDVEDLEPRPEVRDPPAELRRELQARGVPRDAVPRRWERIGDVVVVRLSDEGRVFGAAIAEALATVLRARTVVEDVSGIHGRLRTPEVRVLWGERTDTVHREGGVVYALDVSKVMFSSGNVAERLRVGALARPGDVVVDLFAGIGYFALPLAVRSGAGVVFACELNPDAFSYLTENVRRNRAHNVIPLLGDCRDTAPPGVADLVLMGHFDSMRYLDVAFRCLRGEGTLVAHTLCAKERFPDEPVGRLSAAAHDTWYEVTGTRARIVKSYAPGIVHAVVEATARRRPGGTVTPSSR